MEEERKDTLPRGRVLIIKSCISFIVVPLLLLVVGMIFDGLIFKTPFVFHSRILLVVGFGIAPLIWVRWTIQFSKAGLYVFRTLVFILFFICFNIYLTSYTIGGTSTFFYTNNIRYKLYEGGSPAFKDIKSVPDIYDWMKGQLNDYIFTYGPDFIDVTGAFRIRQVRVKPTPCTNKYISKLTCYPEFEPQYEDRETFGPNNTWVWSSANYKSIVGRDVRPWSLAAPSGTHYPPDGFVMDLVPFLWQNYSLALFQYLQDNEWIDKKTRLISFEFLPFNKNINAWSFANFQLEFNPGGGITPGTPIITSGALPDLRWSGSNDPSQSGDANSFVPLYGLVITFAIFFLFEEIIEMLNDGKKYWKKGGNWVDLTYLLLIFMSLVLRMLSDYYWPIGDTPEYRNQPGYVDLSNTSRLWTLHRQLIGVAGFIVYFNLLRVLKIFPSLALLPRTLLNALNIVAPFFISFALFLFGFAIAFYVVFGDTVQGFRDLSISFVTLWRMMLGDGDMESLVAADPYFGYILYILYTFLAVWVVLTMLIAVLGNAYNNIQEKYEDNERKQLQEISEFFRTKFLRRKPKQEESDIPMNTLAKERDQTTEELLKLILKKIEHLESKIK